MKRDDFIHWVIPELMRFYKDYPYEQPSIDRIDPDGHYELSNMRVISHWDNSWNSRGNPYRDDVARKESAWRKA